MDSSAFQILNEHFPDLIKPFLQPIEQMKFDFSEPGSAAAETKISNLTSEEICGQAVADKAMADCCRSGLLLLNGFLNESHEISQSIHSPEGSYWHGLMHRGEGDFWNSKYWYSKAGKNHPVVVKMREHDSKWCGESFVDACERAVASTDNELRDRIDQLARYEWFYLFQHCWSVAAGVH